MNVNIDETEVYLEATSSPSQLARESRPARSRQHRTATHHLVSEATTNISTQASESAAHLDAGIGSVTAPSSPAPSLVAPRPRIAHGHTSWGNPNDPHIDHRPPSSPRPPPLTSPNSPSLETLTHSQSPYTPSPTTVTVDEDEDPSPLQRKRAFTVAFAPDTVDDSSLGGDGRAAKRVRPPTPYHTSGTGNQEEEDTEDEEVTDQYLDAVQASELDPLELPPQKEAAPLVAPSESITKEPEDDTDEDPSDMFIVITSPTGQRRVWGVSETVASQVSNMLDREQDELLVKHNRGRSTSPFTAGKKRKSEAASEERGRSTLLKTFNGLFSRFLG